MDHSLTSLSYRGSVVEAIVEAKSQKKLLVVFISGDSVESRQLKERTWTSPIVADSISKYCILLHISEGSTDAANFSAIYPQKPAPCITAVGYNGVQLLQIAGFTDAETLASDLQKSWLTIHLQETLLNAALVSENSAPPSAPQVADSSISATCEQGNSSGVNIASPSGRKNAESLENNSQDVKNNESLKHRDLEEMDINLGKKALPGSNSTSTLELDNCKDEVVTSPTERSKPPVSSDKAIGHADVVASSSIEKSEASLTPDKLDVNYTEQGDKAIEDKGDNLADNGKVNSVLKKGSLVKKVDFVRDDKVNKSETVSKPTDVHLNIRLLDGATLQNKFPLRSTLKTVKHYVDENQTNVRATYDLAIPYPRKVFTDEDLKQTLLELGLVGRQALIVVQRDQGSSPSRVLRSLIRDNNSQNSNNEGYFSYLKWILSYANPLSYLGGGATSSNSAQETPGNVMPYGTRPGSGSSTSRGTDATSSSSNSSSKQGKSQWGSNIHTLKHDEEDSQSRDRNNFWNGNSTQYGGGDNDRN